MQHAKAKESGTTCQTKNIVGIARPCTTRRTTPDLVKHARLCLFLRYKAEDPSEWPSIFFSSFQLEAPWARCSLVLIIFDIFSLCFIVMLSKALLVSLFTAVAVAAPAPSIRDLRPRPYADVPYTSES